MTREIHQADIDLAQTLLAAGKPIEKVVASLIYRKLDKSAAETLVGECAHGDPARLVRAEVQAPAATVSAPKSRPVVDRRYGGVAGWLWWFCVGQVFLGPALEAIRLPSTIALVQRTTDTYSQLTPVLVLELLLGIGMLIAGIYVGLQLWVIAPGAVRKVRVYLIARMIAAVVPLFSLLFIDLPPQLAPLSGEAAASTARQVIWCVIWLLYFYGSKRVRATYNFE